MANSSITTPAYTTASAARSGQQNLAGATDALFLKVFGEMVLEAWEQTGVFQDHVLTKTIPFGKSAQFPIIGRKREAQYHTPGELVLGGLVEHNEVAITIDGILYDSIFMSEIDELMNSYDVHAPYARQLGESLALKFDAYVAQLTALAAADTTPAFTGGPVGKTFKNPVVVSDADKLVQFAFASAQYIAENDIGGGTPKIFVRPAQYFLLAQHTKMLYADFGGTANIAKGTIGEVAGMQVVQVKGNRIPSTNLTGDANTPTKYQGDFSNLTALVSVPSAVGNLKVRGFKLTSTYQEDRFGTLMLASQVNGFGVLRKECAIAWSKAPGTD